MLVLIGIVVASTGLSSGCASTEPRGSNKSSVVEDWLYTSVGDFDERAKTFAARADITGVQVVVPWKMLEPSKDKYDFSRVEETLSFLESHKKKMFLQVQDRFFSLPARLPRYILSDPAYAGGMARAAGENGLGAQDLGAVAAQWNSNVRDRFHNLLAALAQKYDGRIYGFNLPETSTQIDKTADRTDYTCDANFAASLDNMRYGRRVFQKSVFVQYVNFWDCEWRNDHKYMERTFQLAKELGIGVGGPDVLPNRAAQMENAYPFFNGYKNRVPLVAMAVQEPDFKYINDATRKPYTRDEFVAFARDYLGAKMIFWATNAPWLQN